MAWRNALQAKSTRVDFLVIPNLAWIDLARISQRCPAAEAGRHCVYDNPGFRTQDAVILVDAPE
jgi:hypothetical protein